jgi:hypothetical protein
MVIATKPPQNILAAGVSRFTGKGGENIIFPALGFIIVLFIWSAVAWLTTQNEYPSELPSVSKTVSDSIPYLQNIFSRKKGDEVGLQLGLRSPP